MPRKNRLRFSEKGIFEFVNYFIIRGDRKEIYEKGYYIFVIVYVHRCIS